MEDDGGLIGVLEEHLLEHIEDDRHKEETGDGNANLRSQPQLREPLGQRAPDVLDETHSAGGGGEEE